MLFARRMLQRLNNLNIHTEYLSAWNEAVSCSLSRALQQCRPWSVIYVESLRIWNSFGLTMFDRKRLEKAERQLFGFNLSQSWMIRIWVSDELQAPASRSCILAQIFEWKFDKSWKWKIRLSGRCAWRICSAACARPAASAYVARRRRWKRGLVASASSHSVRCSTQTPTLLSSSKWHSIIANIISPIAHVIIATITRSPTLNVCCRQRVFLLLFITIFNAIITDEIAVIGHFSRCRGLLKVRFTFQIRLGVSVVNHDAISFGLVPFNLWFD